MPPAQALGESEGPVNDTGRRRMTNHEYAASVRL